MIDFVTMTVFYFLLQFCPEYFAEIKQLLKADTSGNAGRSQCNDKNATQQQRANHHC